MLSIILYKISEHDRVLDEMNVNIEVMKQIIGSFSSYVQLFDNFAVYDYLIFVQYNNWGYLVTLRKIPKKKIKDLHRAMMLTKGLLGRKHRTPFIVFCLFFKIMVY